MQVIATAAMTSRYRPKPGDYYVIQADGYPYLNPKDVFERKYHEKTDGDVFAAAQQQMRNQQANVNPPTD